MPSLNPKIQPLLVQAGFSDFAKLEQVKIDDALVTAWSKGGDLSHTYFIFLLVNA